ncbi:MAG: lipopolysaccharide heptosyltransferase II [Deltaproteobacteria bacterium]|nr:lipopolysaccharide heptosyltransferase II [Deltaproteobacteria bacterium]
MTAEINQIQSQTILVSCPNWVGDVVMATPAFDCIRQNFPAARIVGLIRRYARGVVEDGPWFDELIEINDKTIDGLLHLISQLRGLKPDLAVILPNSFRSVLIARLGGARRIYGYRRNGRTALMTGGPAPWRNNNHITPMPMVEYYMEICRWLNFDRPSQLKPRLFCSDTTLEKGARIIASYGIRPADLVIGMNPGARFGSSKCWPPEHFARLAEMISHRWDCKIMLFIGPGEQDLGQRIVKLSRAKIINTGPDKINLSLLKPLIQRCRLLITNDTGPRHYAVAFDIPVVVIMGPTDPRYTNANLGKTIVLRRELECAPCHHKECAQHHSCMAEISPQEVKRAVEQLLQEHS